MPPLDPASGCPLARGAARRAARRAASRRRGSRCVGARSCRSGSRSLLLVRLRRGGGRAAARHRRRPGSRELGIHYKLGVDGLNLFLIAADDAAVRGRGARGSTLRASGSARGSSTSSSALAETAVLGAFCAQDLALFVAFFDLMLVPFYFLIGRGAGRDRVRGDDQVRHLHAGRLAADARRRRSPPACSPRRDGGDITLRALATSRAAPLSRRARRTGSSCSSRAAFL